MTKSASGSGSEDVLSSIRKLVSAGPEPAKSPPLPVAPDRLLLTPSLRVPDPDAPAAPAAPEVSKPLSLEDRIAELEAAVGSQAQDWEPDGSEVPGHAPPEDLVRAVESEPAEVTELAESHAAAEEEDLSAAGGADAPTDDEPDALDVPAAALLAPEDRVDDLPAEEAVTSPDRDETRAFPLTAVSGLSFRRADDKPEAESVDEAETTDGMDEPSELTEESVEPAEADLATMPDEPEAESEPEDLPSARVLTLRPDPVDPAPEADDTSTMPAGLFFTRHDRPDTETEPETEAQPDAESAVETDIPRDEAGDAAELLPTFRHTVETEAGARQEEGDAELLEQQPEESASSPVDALDDEALRKLITAILRDELQGALGEKITRNVRRLVRREIERALTLRDYD